MIFMYVFMNIYIYICVCVSQRVDVVVAAGTIILSYIDEPVDHDEAANEL